MDFKIPDKEDPKEPSVKGQYNPVTSMGGANTGDSSSLSFYIALLLGASGIITYLFYQRNKA